MNRQASESPLVSRGGVAHLVMGAGVVWVRYCKSPIADCTRYAGIGEMFRFVDQRFVIADHGCPALLLNPAYKTIQVKG